MWKKEVHPIGPSLTSQMHQLSHASLVDQQFVFVQVWAVMEIGSTDHHLVDSKSLHACKNVLNTGALQL